MDNAAKEKIELTSEAIFSVLYHAGDMDLQEVRRRVDAATDMFDMAVGALVARDDIELLQSGGAVIAHRKDPAPAVFPLRGN